MKRHTAWSPFSNSALECLSFVYTSNWIVESHVQTQDSYCHLYTQYWEFGRTHYTRSRCVTRSSPIKGSTNIQERQTSVHSLSGIRTHDYNVQRIRNSAWLRTHGLCDRQFNVFSDIHWKLAVLNPFFCADVLRKWTVFPTFRRNDANTPCRKPTSTLNHHITVKA
jgi:hypothetical protein